MVPWLMSHAALSGITTVWLAGMSCVERQIAAVYEAWFADRPEQAGAERTRYGLRKRMRSARRAGCR
jgi:hypothetical protein